jgi:hypothetical protein
MRRLELAFTLRLDWLFRLDPLLRSHIHLSELANWVVIVRVLQGRHVGTSAGRVVLQWNHQYCYVYQLLQEQGVFYGRARWVLWREFPNVMYMELTRQRQEASATAITPFETVLEQSLRSVMCLAMAHLERIAVVSGL